MQDTLIILEAVNQFYSQSFNQLVAIFIAVLAFAGVVMPILISLYQKRLFKLEHEEIKLSLQNKLTQDLSSALENIRTEYESKESEYEKKIIALDEKLEKEIAGAFGGSLHIQGNMSIKEGHYLAAFISLTKASTNHIKADKETNLKRALKIISGKCLPELNKKSLEADEATIENFEDLLLKLEEYNINGRYLDDIKKLKHGFKQAMEREPKKNA